MVCVLPRWVPDDLLQKIAAEHHLPATAFLVDENDHYSIRWFTPEYEIDLCGHGTLASGYIILNKLEPHRQEVTLYHPSGPLRVFKKNDLISLDFPIKDATKIPIPNFIEQGLGLVPRELYEFKKERLLAIFNSEEEIKQLIPDMLILNKMEHRGIIVTALGKNYDFVSRVFYPKKTIYEDAVTGSSFCLLLPYWKKQLNKTEFKACQLSKRGGVVICEIKDNRALISSKATLYMQGIINLDV